ncbi:MAG: hypothetical protein O7E57_06705 [Gammaproteobacteria bacterium]|nr:hypothetical protein [Gammaproteobacteria bacterium]
MTEEQRSIRDQMIQFAQNELNGDVAKRDSLRLAFNYLLGAAQQ